MKIAVGSDHRGVAAKDAVVSVLRELGIDPADYGTSSREPCDYPDMALAVAKAVADGSADRGVLLCGTGIGMSIAANKVQGVRAALCYDEFSAEMSRRHNDANILCIGADRVSTATIQHIVRAWLRTEFEGGRHLRRVDKIRAFENGAADHDCG